MEPLTRYTIAIIYQQKALPESTKQGMEREQMTGLLRLSRRLIHQIRQTVIRVLAERQPKIASNPLIECYREQE